MWAITHRYQFGFKKKNQVKSPSPESRVPETGSDPPIGSGRESGRDRSNQLLVFFTFLQDPGIFLSQYFTPIS